MKFVIRYRNRNGTLCSLTLPLRLYSYEECSQAALDIRREGHRILEATVDFGTDTK